MSHLLCLCILCWRDRHVALSRRWRSTRSSSCLYCRHVTNGSIPQPVGHSYLGAFCLEWRGDRLVTKALLEGSMWLCAEVSTWLVRRKETESQGGGEDLTSGTPLVGLRKDPAFYQTSLLYLFSEQIFVELRMQAFASIYTQSAGG